MLVRFPEDGLGLLVHEQDQLRPSTGKMEPVRVLRIISRNGCLQAVDELAQATRSVLGWGGSNTDAHPGLGRVSAWSCDTECSKPSMNKVVDVDPDVMVVEGQIDGSLNGQAVGLLAFTNTRCPFGYLTVKEDRPALLQESEERLPVRGKRFKRPIVEESDSDVGVG